MAFLKPFSLLDNRIYGFPLSKFIPGIYTVDRGPRSSGDDSVRQLLIFDWRRF